MTPVIVSDEEFALNSGIHPSRIVRIPVEIVLEDGQTRVKVGTNTSIILFVFRI